jgi:hypothetical protein
MAKATRATVKKSSDAAVHVLGVRHHGPGSARSVRRALGTIRPDIVLVEGPPDADELLPLLTHAEMKPPVAILIYAVDRPKEAVYYPFAVFSPECQAIQFALTNAIPVRFMDLPQAHQLGLPEAPEVTDESTEGPAAEANGEEGSAEPDADGVQSDLTARVRRDPLQALAQAAGYSDGERWWEYMVEHRRDGADLFSGIRDAMSALREDLPPHPDPREALREAHMRQTIRAAQREGFQSIAVICGAWHAPALSTMPPAAQDAALLKGLPKGKVKATWVPWTYGRLTSASGYGAGIDSPGWYQHLWEAPDRVIERWLARVARLFREEDLDASPAHVIESVRLADALATMRGRRLPGLDDLQEAIQSVFCFGDALPMRLIQEKLIVGELLGEVPAETPVVPLQQDLTREQKRLRLAPDASQKPKELDLREATDLARSHLLHRLAILNIPWGETRQASGLGTFKELWLLQWKPEFAVALIEAAIWGNTVLDAATARARDLADRAADLPQLTSLLDNTLLADLPEAVHHVMDRLDAEAALASDVTHLMGALPPLANVLRYGDVRKTDTTQVSRVVDGLVARICIGLPGACASLNDDAAGTMFDLLLKVHGAIDLIPQNDHQVAWCATLRQLADRQSLHGLVAGRCCRLLLDAGEFSAEEAANRLALALSVAGEPSQAAAWVEGLLKGSGLILLHDDALWNVLDAWVSALAPEAFTRVLPLIRRTFSTFAAPERRQMGERARRGAARVTTPAPTKASFDQARADAVLPLIARLLGVDPP